jgi:hypothetical protein
MIWLKSLLGPRIIEVQRWFGDEYDFCNSDCPIPTALLVNHEAREVALEFCKPWFVILRAPAEIYFLTRKSTGASASRRHSLGRPGLSPLG